jgi:multidrug transporter EmrE-like cation transporter
MFLIYLILTTSGLIFIKSGGSSGPLLVKGGAFLGFTVNWISAIGFICYLCSFLLFTKIIVTFNLSYIVPISTGIVQVLILLASKFIFKETISSYGLIGAIIIIIGIIIMNIPNNISNQIK